MIRLSPRLFVLDGITYQALQIGLLPVLAQDISPDEFHSTCMPGLYEPVSASSPVGKCHKLFNRRVITALPCTWNKRTLLVPFLVGTGAPQTYLHTIALDKFQVLRDGLNVYKVEVAGIPLRATENFHSDGSSVVSHLNILGMDFLEEATPDLLTYFSERFVEHQSRQQSIPVWVQECDNSGNRIGAAFKVSPTSIDVDALKKAILPTAPPLDQARLTIFAPGTTAPVQVILEPDLALTFSTAKRPYLFKLPN